MAKTTTRLIPGLLAGGLLLLPLAGCSGSSGTSTTAGGSTAATTTVPGVATASASISAGLSGGAGISGSAGSLQCSGTSCSLTLNTANKSATVAGQTIALNSVSNGKAMLDIAGQTASCTQGQTVNFGPAQFTCSTVTDSSVTLTGSLTGALGGGSASPTTSPTS